MDLPFPTFLQGSFHFGGMFFLSVLLFQAKLMDGFKKDPLKNWCQENI